MVSTLAVMLGVFLGAMNLFSHTPSIFAAPPAQNPSDPCSYIPTAPGFVASPSGNRCSAVFPFGVVSVELTDGTEQARSRVDLGDKFFCNIPGTPVTTYGEYAKEWNVAITADGGCSPQNDPRFPKRYFLNFSLACASVSLAGQPGTTPAVKTVAEQIDQKLKTSTPCSNIEHIEVVQVIQDVDNTVPLVAGKSTVVRVFVKADANQKPVAVSAVLRNVRTSQELPPSNGPLTPPLKPSRANIDDSFNFFLPSEWTAEGEVTFEAEIKIPGQDPIRPNNNKSKTKPLRFTKRNTLTVAYMPMCIEPSGPQSTACADGDTVVKHDQLMAKIFPVADKDSIYFGLKTPAVAWRKPLVTDQDGAALLAFVRKIYFLIDASGADLFDQLAVWLPYDAAIKSAGGFGDTIGYLPASTGHVSWQEDTSALGMVYPQKTLAHEVGHALGLLHPGTADACRAAQPRSGWPYRNATIQEFGFDVQAKKVVPNTWFDVMSYCDPNLNWISPYQYKRLFDGNLRPRPPQYSAALNLSPKTALFPIEAIMQPRSDYLIVSGSAKRDGSAGNLDPAYRVTSASPADPSDPSGNYCLRFIGASGKLADYCFTLRFESHQEHSVLDEEAFTVKVPFPLGTMRVLLLRGEKELASLSTTPTAPTVNVTSPRPNETWDGKRTISWSAASSMNSALTYAVLYTADGGKSWFPIDLDSKESQVTLDTSKIASGDQIQFRILATDGLNTAQTDSAPVKIPRRGEAANLNYGSIAPIAAIGGGAILLVVGLAGGLILVRRRQGKTIAEFKAPTTLPETSSRPSLLPEDRKKDQAAKPTDLPH